MAHFDHFNNFLLVKYFGQFFRACHVLFQKGLFWIWFATPCWLGAYSPLLKESTTTRYRTKDCFAGSTVNYLRIRGQYLFLRMKFILLIILCLIHPVFTVSLAPKLNIDTDGYGTYIINLDNDTLSLEYHADGIVLYNADLVRERQLYTVSKILDLTHSGIANVNMLNSLSRYSKAQDFGTMHEFILIDQYEFFVTDFPLQYEDCTILCASKGSLVIFDPAHYYKLAKRFPYKTFWLNTQTRVDRIDGEVVSYHVYFGYKQIFPVNMLTTKGAARIFYQQQGQKIEISTISTFYDKYFDSQSGSYWSTEAYNLQAAIDGNGEISLFIPTQNMVLSGDAFANCCSCGRKLSHSRRLYHKMSSALNVVGIQQSRLNVSIEGQRFRTGDIMTLITTQMHKELTTEMENNLFNGTCTLQDIEPLRVSSNETHDKLLLPSAVSFTAKAVGVPLLQKGFQHYMTKFSSEIKGRMVDYVSRTDFKLPTSVELSGLQSEINNFSLRIVFNDISQYEGNVTSSIDDTTRLLRNLSVTNDALEHFLTTYAMEYMVGLAEQDLPLEIDTDMPVIAVVYPSSSFILYKFLFSCILPEPAVTIYEAFALPFRMVADDLQALDIPARFTTNGFNYEFDSEKRQNKGLPQCIDAILSGHISDTCDFESFTDRRIVRGITLINYYVFYVYTADTGAQLKIDCPRFKQVNIKCEQMVTVVAVSPSCALGLTTAQGTLTMKRNSSYSGRVRSPFYLFSYDVPRQNSSDYYQMVLLIIVIVVVILLILLIGGVAYYVLYYKVSEVVTMTDTYTPFGSMETVRGVSYVPSPTQ